MPLDVGYVITWAGLNESGYNVCSFVYSTVNQAFRVRWRLRSGHSAEIQI